MICFLLIICAISGGMSAPPKMSQLFTIIANDNRTENLRKHPFVAECKRNEEFSKSLCYAMYDIALSFNSKKLPFTTSNATYKDNFFCGALNHVLPQIPANIDSFNAFKDSAQWFKDGINNEDGEEICKENCFYEDRISYERKLTPVCQFIMNQYSYLADLNSTPSLVFNSSEGQKINERNETVVTSPATSAAHAIPAVDPVQKNVTSSEAPASKMSNETLSLKQSQSSPVIDNKTSPIVGIKASPATGINTNSISGNKTIDEKIKVANSTEAPSKPVVQTTAPSMKKPETTKSKAKVKTDDPVKDEDLGNLENGEDNVFDAEGEGDQLETVDKDQTDTKGGEYHDDDEDEYSEDAMARNNNIINNKPQVDLKLPLEADPTLVDDVPHKKIEIVNFQEDPDSNFFTYLCGLMFMCVLLYILHQNRQKLLALCLEGRRGNRRARERSRGGSKAAYSKLDCNLEEAIMSKKSLTGKSMDIIY